MKKPVWPHRAARSQEGYTPPVRSLPAEILRNFSPDFPLYPVPAQLRKPMNRQRSRSDNRYFCQVLPLYPLLAQPGDHTTRTVANGAGWNDAARTQTRRK